MIAEFEARILALIDDMVEHASDDELFAGGYLRGHLTLAVAESEEHAEHSAEQLKVRVQSSLDKAIKAGELSRRIRYWCWACGKTCIRQRCRLSNCFKGDSITLAPQMNYTSRPFSSFLTHMRFGFNAANISLSPGKGSPNS